MTSMIVLLVASAVTPVGEPERVKWGKRTGFVPADDGVTFSAAGPAKVIFTLYGKQNTTLSVEIIRDGSFVSANNPALKNKRGGPKGYSSQTTLGVTVPEGEHTYTIKPSTSDLVITATNIRRIPAKARAAAETELPKEDPPTVVAAQTPAEVAPAEAPTFTEAEVISAQHENLTDQVTPPLDGTPADRGRITNLQQAKRVAIYNLDTQEVSETVGAVVTDSLVTEVRKLQGLSVIGMDEIRDMLSHEANKQFLGCETDESCLAEIAGALGVDDLITGKLSKAANEHVMVVRRIDQRRAKVAGTFNQRLKMGSGQEFLLSVGPAVEDLFPEHAIREGASRGVADEVALRLDPPPLPPWAFYATAGAALAAAAAGGVLGLLANSSETSFNELASGDAVRGITLVAHEDAANGRALGANVSYATAGGLAIAAAIMFLFTDWHGYGDVQIR